MDDHPTRKPINTSVFRITKKYPHKITLHIGDTLGRQQKKKKKK